MLRPVGERKKTADADKAPRTKTPIRVRIAQVVWALFALAALFLAVGALLIAVNANRDNALVRFVLDAANTLDLGIFSRSNGIKHFGGANAEVKNALLNWGLAAIAWLVLGRILERMIRP
jgi:ABC-type glucose/galactose transport system permease subunit